MIKIGKRQCYKGNMSRIKAVTAGYCTKVVIATRKGPTNKVNVDIHIQIQNELMVRR